MEKDIVTLVLGGATVLVSLSVGLVAYSQMRIASAKAKLDLYNKRFAIYVAALDLYLALWSDHSAVARLAPAMTRAYRESQFLFAGPDGIYETIGKLQQHGLKAKYHLEEIIKLESPPLGRSGVAGDHRKKKSDELSAYEIELKVLEQKIAKYLVFTSVAGRSLTGFFESKPALLNTEARRTSE